MELTDRQTDVLGHVPLAAGVPQKSYECSSTQNGELITMNEIWVFCLVWVVLCVLSVYVLYGCVHVCIHVEARG